MKYFLAFLLASTLTFAKETRKKIIIIDTGIKKNYLKQYYCEEGHFSTTGTGIYDLHGHGSNIAYLVMKGLDPKKYCFSMIKYVDHGIPFYEDALSVLNTLNGDFLNLSLTGPSYLFTEDTILFAFLQKGGRIAAAAGNKRINLDLGCNSYPSCSFFLQKLDNFHSVGSLDFKGKRLSSSNYGKVVKHWELGLSQGPPGLTMTGTSQATAIHLNKWIKSLEKR